MLIRKEVSIAGFAFFGGCARFLLTAAWSAAGTLISNLLGCFLLAALTYYGVNTIKGMPDWLAAGLGTGFVGAFTTFSSFNLDFLKLQQANSPYAMAYLLGSIFLGLACAYFGAFCGERTARWFG
ncbi:fluoride efflux transporter FluC [Lactobacillus corticis]|uniref:Fluoride-specific ion channel FluC n=1 Tax=Lactobacillus corticis TaxID=2201249 RepID=A0A916QJ32_9LACO|nr:CrcB family protein [Lactobacillus corticis]GFZ27142.1 chromosome condensation protein CrcB [Lactobacillus corticis]